LQAQSFITHMLQATVQTVLTTNCNNYKKNYYYFSQMSNDLRQRISVLSTQTVAFAKKSSTVT